MVTFPPSPTVPREFCKRLEAREFCESSEIVLDGCDPDDEIVLDGRDPDGRRGGVTGRAFLSTGFAACSRASVSTRTLWACRGRARERLDSNMCFLFYNFQYLKFDLSFSML